MDSANTKIANLKLFYSTCDSIYKQGQFLIGNKIINSNKLEDITAKVIKSGDINIANSVLKFIEDSQKSLKNESIKPENIISGFIEKII